MVAAENKTNRTPPRVLPFFLKKRFEMVEALEFEKARDAAFKI